MEIKTSYINEKKVYLIDGVNVGKVKLLKTIKDLVKINNKLYYNNLKNNGFDYIKQYYKYDGYIMDYKTVKNDILNNGLIYNFSISLGV